MAGILKRIVAVLVSIVWLSLILVLLAGFFVPDLHQLLPPPVREFTDPEVLRERWQSFTDSLVTGIGVQPPAEPVATETPTPDAALSTAPTQTPVPEAPTSTPPPVPSPTPTTPPAMSSDDDEETPALEISVSVSEAGQADLRSAPSEDADVIGLVAAGGKVNVNGQDSTGNWYRLEDGTWISADDLVEAPLDQVPVVMVETQQPPEGPQEPSPPSDAETDTPSTERVPVSAVVNADSNLRAGPGIEYDRVDGINFGEEASIVGISADGEWYLLENGVWLFAALVTEAVDVPVQQAATEETQEDTEETDIEQADTDDESTTETEQTETDAEQPQPVVIAPRGANLRAGPGLEYDRVDGAEEGQILAVVAQDESGEWLKLEDGSWIFAALVENVPENLPEESEEVTEEEQDEQDAQTDEDEQETQEKIEPVVFSIVNTDANLRNGPGLDATIVESASAGTQVTIVDRSDDEQWLQLDNGFWIFATLVDILPVEGEEDTGTEDTDDNNNNSGNENNDGG